MSSRSTQAFRLGRALSEAAEVQVELVYDTGARWYVEWGDGPTIDQMRARVSAALAGPHYPAMRDRQLAHHRGWTPRAWASRAIAARRDGNLTREVTARAAYHRQHPWPPFRGSTLTPEDHATLAYIEQLIDATPYPDRASAPEDEPLIEQLLAASEGNEYKMAAILRNADRAPVPTPAGPTLRAVPREAGR